MTTIPIAWVARQTSVEDTLPMTTDKLDAMDPHDRKVAHWAAKRRAAMENAQPDMLAQMQKAGTLEDYLTEIGHAAQSMWNQIFNEALVSVKDETMQDRFDRAMQAPHIANELVMADLINPAPDTKPY